MILKVDPQYQYSLGLFAFIYCILINFPILISTNIWEALNYSHGAWCSSILMRILCFMPVWVARFVLPLMVREWPLPLKCSDTSGKDRDFQWQYFSSELLSFSLQPYKTFQMCWCWLTHQYFLKALEKWVFFESVPEHHKFPPMCLFPKLLVSILFIITKNF